MILASAGRFIVKCRAGDRSCCEYGEQIVEKYLKTRQLFRAKVYQIFAGLSLNVSSFHGWITSRIMLVKKALLSAFLDLRDTKARENRLIFSSGCFYSTFRGLTRAFGSQPESSPLFSDPPFVFSSAVPLSDSSSMAQRASAEEQRELTLLCSVHSTHASGKCSAPS